MPLRSTLGVLLPSLGVVSVSSELWWPLLPVTVLNAASMKEAPADGRRVRLLPRILGRDPLEPELEPGPDEPAPASICLMARSLVLAVIVSLRPSIDSWVVVMMLVDENPAGERPAGEMADALGGEDDRTASSASLDLSRLKWNRLPIFGRSLACSLARLDASSRAALAAARAPSGPVRLLGRGSSCDLRWAGPAM